MEGIDAFVLLGLAAVLTLPLAREYADLRRSCGLSRAQALATTLLVLPASLAGAVVTAPLADRPALHWTATVLFALFVYSLAARSIVARASAAATAPSRNT